jgi:methylisocitrate lyase
MATLKTRLAGDEPVLAPLVLNPLMARLAEAAGFEALYLGGGAAGYQGVFLEANLTLTEMARAGVEIKSATGLPLILDGACGWGDPMHMHRTIPMAEAAGFAAIEIEDQLLPKRAHHHVGIEHMVPKELMAAKIREAVAARRDPDFLIIARSNGVRSSSMDDALERAEAYHAAGADLLLLLPRNAEEARHIGERLPAPLMHLLTRGGPKALGLEIADMAALGFRLLVDPQTPLLAAYRAWRDCYRALAEDMRDPSLDAEAAARLQEELHDTIGLERLLEIERETVERDCLEAKDESAAVSI